MADKSATTTHDTAAVSAPKEVSPSPSVMANPIAFLQRTAGNRAVSAVLADRGEGAPLPDGLRGTFEPLFARSLADVRIHSGPRAADLVHGIGARAFTRGSDIYLGENADRPSTIAHELAHTVQQDGASPQSRVSARGDRDEREARDAASRVLAGLPAHVASGTAESAVQCDDPPPEGYELTGDPDRPLKEVDPPEADEDSALPLDKPLTFPIAVSEKRPELLVVPEEATRRDIARVLLGDETRDAEFDFFAPPEGGRAVRLRNPDLLLAEGKTLMREKLDAVLETDYARVIAILGFTYINDDEEWELAESVLRWSQRSNIHTEDGTSYFDKYLTRLSETTISGTFGNSTALTKLMDEASNKAEQVRKAITLRSSMWSVGYTVEDQRPAFARGDVVGRFYFSTGSGVQLKVVEQIAAEPTPARAELIARNTMAGGLRVVIPGSDGMFYAYLLIDTTIQDPLIPRPQDDPGGNYYWYYPGTIAVLPGSFEADAPAAGEDTADLRRSLLDEALHEGTLKRLASIDFSVLAVATTEERLTMLTLALAGEGGTHASNFAARVIYTTPNGEFPALERAMDSAGLIERIVNGAMENPSLRVIASIFTSKTLTALPIGAESLADMPQFTLGYDEAGVFHFVWASPKRVESQLIASDQWNPASAVRVGNEPAGPGDTPGPVTRNAIVFQQTFLRGGMGNLVFDTANMSGNVGPLSRPLLPTELVQINQIGAKPQTVIVSALEASTFTLTMAEFWRQAVQPAIDLNILAMSALGVVRAFGPALASGLVRQGVRGGLTALTETAATQAGKAALHSAILSGVLVGGNQAIEANREELEQTAEGRAFIAAWHVAMLALVAKDIYAIAKSGLIGEVARLASRTYGALSRAAALRLRNAIDDLRAFQLTAQRWAAAEQRVASAVAPGVGEIGAAASASKLPDLTTLFRMTQAEVRSASVVTALSEAGASTKVADKVFARLQELAKGNKSMSLAQRDIATHASTLTSNPAALDEFLVAVELTVGARTNTAHRIAGFLRAAAKSPNPVSYLDDVRWLLSRNGVAADAIEQLGEKAQKGRLDLGWLNSTSLTDRDLSYLGKDPQTPWHIFQRVAEGRASKSDVIWAQRSMRGIAAEITARRNASTLFPGEEIAAQQVEMGDSVLDFVLRSTEGLSRRRGLEVKGWTPDTWKEVLSAWRNRDAGLALAAGEGKLAERIDRMVKQLQDAQSTLGKPPVLAISDKLSAADEVTLRAILAESVPGCTIVKMSDASIVSLGNELRTAVGIPVAGAK